MMLNKLLQFAVLLHVLLHVRKIDALSMYWQPEPAVVGSKIWVTCYKSFGGEINWWLDNYKVAVSYQTYTRNFWKQPYLGRCKVSDMPDLDVSARLILNPIKRPDNGVKIYCVTGGGTTKYFTMTVYAPVKNLYIGNYYGEIPFIAGYSRSCHCTATYVKPNAVIKWYWIKDREVYLTRGVYKQSKTGYGFVNVTSTMRVRLNNVDHRREVYCRGYNDYNNGKVITSTHLRLMKKIKVNKVYISNNVSGKTALIKVRENVATDIYCSANKTDPETIITFWEVRRNRQKILPLRQQRFLRHSGLYTTESMTRITPDRRDDGVKIYCHGRNIFAPDLDFPGVNSRNLVVEILHAPYDPPVISGINSNKFVYENAKVKVYCSWRGGNPDNARVTLKCPGNTPTTDTLTVSKYMTVSKLMHRKHCICTGSHTYKRMTATSTQVFKVSFRPVVKMISTTSKIKGRRQSNITCYIQSDGNPPEYIFRPWEHWWGQIHLRTLSGTSHPRFTEIVSFSSTHQDSGTYKCTVINGNAQTGRIFFQSSELKVKIPSKPVIALQRFTIKAAEGADALLSLKFYSYPNYSSITWLKMNDIINPEYHFIKENVVTFISYKNILKISGFKVLAIIKHLSLDDFGKYTVNISNAEGWVIQPIVILLGRREPEAIVGVAGDLPIGIPIAAFFVGLVLTVGVAVIIRYIFKRMLLKEIAEHEQEVEDMSF